MKARECSLNRHFNSGIGFVTATGVGMKGGKG
jgi:hypothetical protein